MISKQLISNIIFACLEAFIRLSQIIFTNRYSNKSSRNVRSDVISRHIGTQLSGSRKTFTNFTPTNNMLYKSLNKLFKRLTRLNWFRTYCVEPSSHEYGNREYSINILESYAFTGTVCPMRHVSESLTTFHHH